MMPRIIKKEPVMKKALSLIVVSLILLLSACGGGSDIPPGGSATPTPSDIILPGVPGGTQNPEPTDGPSASQYKSKLYDPSIFVIQASGTSRQELAPGFYADYECDIYLHKVDANDNRVSTGVYQGVFWMKVTSDTEGFISDMIGSAPIDISFDVGGEAVCDTLGIMLNITDDKAWVNYSIAGEDGKPIPLTQDAPVGKGSFVAVAKNVYLKALASGAQGEKIDYSDASQGDLTDVNYVINVEPDDMESGARRNLVINLNGEGFNFTLKGEMLRLPGYPEDVSDYFNSDYKQNSAWRHFQ
jgi:hypothetical protein